jgi:hypothetical protein
MVECLACGGLNLVKPANNFNGHFRLDVVPAGAV